MVNGDEHKLFGAGMAVITAAVPDGILSVGQKILVAVVVAFLSGFAYAAGRGLWNRIVKKD